MSDLVLLSAAHMRRIEPFFPRSRGLARVDDRRVVGGIIYVIRYGLQWKDAPPGYGPHKTLTIGLSAEAGSACSPASLPLWPAKAACPSA